MVTSVIPARHAARAPPICTTENELLACLPLAARALWAPHLELVDLERGQLLHEADGRIPYAYFPLTAVVAKLYLLESGASAASVIIGNEGMVGFPLVLGGESTPSRAVVLVAGEAWRVKADFIRSEVRLVTPVLHLMLRFVQAMMTQVTQTAVCNRHHPIDAQLCRWLLLSMDRLQGKELVMTQELIANMLGVRREGVTEAAGKLQRAGLIGYHRGHITILNREGLEKRTCECYQVVQKEYDRLLPDRTAI
jgi:CRP-like cAMP-binding protein